MRNTRVLTTLAVFSALVGLTPMDGAITSARAEVNINVNIGPPPPIVVRERPTMVYLTEPAVFVAVGVPYDVYFVSGHYYYMHGDNWFWASGYEGPWVHVTYRSLPPGLQHYQVVRLHEFREREYRVYKVQGPKFKGKYFVADPGPGKHDRDDHDDHGENHNNGKGNNGRGRGHN